MTSTRAGSKRESLLLALLTLFIGFFVTAEIIGGKLWEFTLLGLEPRMLGLGDNQSFVATAGIFAFPLTFLLTDVINEYFGTRIVRRFTYLALAVNVILQPVIWAAMAAPTVSFTPGLAADDAHRAYEIAFGQTSAIVAASMLAFLIGQLVDALMFAWLRRKTGGKLLWLRAQGSTIVSQLIDTWIVIFAAFVVIPSLLGREHMSVGDATVISTTNYVYKFAIAVVMTPLLYVVHGAIKRYLGAETALELSSAAHPSDPR